MAPYTVLCTYLVKPERIDEVRALLGRHWPALRRFGYVTEDEPRVYFGTDYSGPFFAEIMTWADDSAPGKAYWTPEINEIWSGLYEHTEYRDGRPGIDYPTVEPRACAAAPGGAEAESLAGA